MNGFSGFSWRSAARPLAVLPSMVAVLLAVGCASKPEAPELLTFTPQQYAAAFDAACEAARVHGMPATLRDRRGGRIETEPRIAGSILEPWRTDNASLSQALESTVVYQRRRARFEFLPVGHIEQTTTDDGLTGPDIINADQQPLDLTAIDGDIELRVWVYLERANLPGQRRSTWTRSKTSQAVLVYPEGMSDRRNVNVVWAPAARDPEYERRLLAKVRELFASNASPPAPDSARPDSAPPDLSQPDAAQPENPTPLAMLAEPPAASSE